MNGQNPLRRLIGTSSVARWMLLFGWSGERSFTYELPDALEVETRDWSEIVWHRVLFDDVRLITWRHYRRNVAMFSWLGGTLVIVFFFLWISLYVTLGSGRGSTSDDTKWVLFIVAAIISLPGLIGFILTAIPVCEITVQGERTQAVLRFPTWRKMESLTLRDRLTKRIRTHQTTVTAENLPGVSRVELSDSSNSPTQEKLG